MADATFNDVLDEQKQTTGTLTSLGENLREQLLGDKSQERTEAEVAASNKAWQIRQEIAAKDQEKIDTESLQYDVEDDKRQSSMLKLAALQLLSFTIFKKADKIAKKADEKGKIDDRTVWGRMLDKLNFIGKGTESAAKKKESKKDEQSFMSKTFGKLLKGMGKTLMTPLKVVGGGILALLTAGGLLALGAFLRSPIFEKIRLWLLNEAGPALDFLWNEILVPLGKWFGGKFTNFWEDLKVFWEKEDWESFKELVGDNKAMVAGLALLITPKWLGIVALVGAWVLLKGAVGLLVSTLMAIGGIGATAAASGSLMAAATAAGLTFLKGTGIAAAAATVGVASYRGTKAYQLMREEYEKEWYEALFTGASVFFVNLFKIPADFLISEKMRTAFSIWFNDTILETIPKLWDDLLMTPIVDFFAEDVPDFWSESKKKNAAAFDLLKAAFDESITMPLLDQLERIEKSVLERREKRRKQNADFFIAMDKLNRTFDEKIIMPLLDNVELLKARWKSDMDKLIGYWEGILGLLQSGWEKIARVLLGVEEKGITMGKMTDAERAAMEKAQTSKDFKIKHSFDAAEVGLMRNEGIQDAIEKAGGIDPNRLFGRFGTDAYKNIPLNIRDRRGKQFDLDTKELLLNERKAKEASDKLTAAKLDLSSRGNGNNAGQSLSVVTDSSINTYPMNNNHFGPTSIVDFNMIAPHQTGNV